MKSRITLQENPHSLTFLIVEVFIGGTGLHKSTNSPAIFGLTGRGLAILIVGFVGSIVASISLPFYISQYNYSCILDLAN